MKPWKEGFNENISDAAITNKAPAYGTSI